MRKNFSLISKTSEYKCEVCGKTSEYFHGDCFLYYDCGKDCSCGGKQRLVDKL